MPDGGHLSDRSDQTSCGTGIGLKLRILATSDMHMHLLPHDYLADRPCDRFGLARTADMIQRLRAEGRQCLLLDNGDFLQGAPMGDVVASKRGCVMGGPFIMSAANMGTAASGHKSHGDMTAMRQKGGWVRGWTATQVDPVTAASFRT